MPADFDAYLRALAKTPVEEKTEHTDRAALETLLRQSADDAEPGAHVQHEPRRDKSGAGSPDYKVTRVGRIAGYVEVKAIDENLSKVLRSDQIKKYRTLTDNLILTDYLDFVWIRPDGEQTRERLAHANDLSAKKLALKPDRVEAVRTLLRGFFSAAPEHIRKGKDLAMALARRAALLRDFLAEELQRQEKDDLGGRLIALYGVFKTQVFHDLAVADFADAFAQMLAYGLFLARLNAGPNETVTLENVRTHIPGSFALIRELVRFLDEMNEDAYGAIRWVIDELLSIVNGIDLAAIDADLSFRARKAVSRKVRAGDEEEHRLFERDPFIYFYEDFLKAYDPAMRKGRGVYYTPPPVVNFIVRAIDDILKENFGIEKGLADHNKVTVLDFACGTGTFLLEVFEKIFDDIGGPEAGAADLIVRNHLLKNLYGFEYLIAPYTIAHLKLSQYLKDKGHPLKGDERLQVFLTNTLEPVAPQRDLMLPALSREVEAAQAVKDKPILVITGNPPYSGQSKNKGEWISRAIDGYKFTIERDAQNFEAITPLGERNSKWLNDDYVKFIRFAQMKIDAVDQGVVGIITNHSWLDNPTFRGMRQSLMRTFDQIYVLDLHGNTKKKERAPGGGKDENVFDIEQGVAISLFIKRPGSIKGIYHADIYGRRIEKYRELARSSIEKIDWSSPDFFTPYYFMVPIDWRGWDTYSKGFQVADALNGEGFKQQIYRTWNVGLATGRDEIAIQYTLSDIQRVVTGIQGGSEITFKQDWHIDKFSAEWSWKRIHTDITSNSGNFIQIHYRPFDERFTYYTGQTNGFLSRPRRELTIQMDGKNLSLITSRLTKGEAYSHVDVTDSMAEAICLSPTTSNNGFMFPIRTRLGEVWVDNITPDVRSFLDARYDHHYTPEEVLGYIYAALYAPTYRTRYAEFLRIDFPRIPFPDTKPEFDRLSELGWALVQAHLLKAVPKPKPRLGRYSGKGDHAVEQVRWSPEEEAIWINKTQRFAPVPEAVWAFHIGGYQVLDKYLKSRKGRTLSLDEIGHVGAVAETLAFTIDQMAAIDEAYRAAFPAGDKAAAALAPSA